MNIKKIIMFVLVLFGPISILYFLNKSEHVFVTPPYIGGYEVTDDGDTNYYKVPEYNFYNTDGKKLKLEGKIVILFAVQNTCYSSEDIYDCGYYPFHIEQILYEDIFKNKKKYNDLIMVSVVTDENGEPTQASDFLIDQFSVYDSEVWTLAEGDLRPFYDFNYEGNVYLHSKNESAYGNKAFLSTLLLIDKERHIRGFFGGRLNAEVREFKDRLSVLKKYYQVKNG